MGCAPLAHVLWSDHMKFSPSNDKWWNRDRFVLSNGHACALLYSMLHLTGYKVTIDDLKQFRQFRSVTPGHPENFMTEGVEVSTGPLGQGITNAVGMAIAAKHLGAVYNRPGFDIIDNFTYVICGDGCLQEGISSEASSLAGHLRLGKLVVLYDDNLITIDGSTELSFTEDVAKRYESYGWHVQTVVDANDLASLNAAVAAAKADEGRPSLIKIRTVIGAGSAKEGTSGVHGAPLGAVDLANVKTMYGFNPEESFVVPDDVRAHYSSCAARGEAAEGAWDELFAKYSNEFPDQAAELSRRFRGELPANWRDALPVYDKDSKDQASRQYSQTVLNNLAGVMPELVGGSADLTPSNLTALKCSGDFSAATPAGRYIRYGVREHAMVAINNGMYAYGAFRPFAATFLNFWGYAMGAIRVAALSRFGTILIATHDSIGLGEDGPTHQPVEMIESMRSMPGIAVLRPADGRETAGCYAVAMERTQAASVLCLSRQGLPHLEGSTIDACFKGGYVLQDIASPKLIITASGSETGLAVKAAAILNDKGVATRVVSMPCMCIFDEQSTEYKLECFPAGVPVLSVEAAAVGSWAKYAHVSHAMTTFGASAPASKLFAHFGFTPENIASKGEKTATFYTGADWPTGAPSLVKKPIF